MSCVSRLDRKFPPLSERSTPLRGRPSSALICEEKQTDVNTSLQILKLMNGIAAILLMEYFLCLNLNFYTPMA